MNDEEKQVMKEHKTMEVDRVSNFSGPVHLALAGWLAWFQHCTLPRPDSLPTGRPETLCHLRMGESFGTGNWCLTNPYWNPGTEIEDCPDCETRYAKIKEAIAATRAEHAGLCVKSEHARLANLMDAARKSISILDGLGYVAPEAQHEHTGYAKKLLENALSKFDLTEDEP